MNKYKINIQLFAELTVDKTEIVPSDTEPKLTNAETQEQQDTSKDNEITSEQERSTTTINADNTSVDTSLTPEALAEIELALKDTPATEVQLFQRELSKALKVDLFSDKGAVELFERYSPENLARVAKANEVADKVNNSTKSINAEQDDVATELLRTKIELELLKNGCPQDWLNDAVILAQSKVKSNDDLSAVKAIASRYAGIMNQAMPAGAPRPIRTSAGIGEKAKELTDGERAVQYLRQKNPDGFKK